MYAIAYPLRATDAIGLPQPIAPLEHAFQIFPKRKIEKIIK